MTHCQEGMHEAISRKWLQEKPAPSTYKLKKFSTNISPRTSTKRGATQFYSIVA